MGVGESYQHLPFLGVWTGCVCGRTQWDVLARPAGHVEHRHPERFKYGCPCPLLLSSTSTPLPPLFTTDSPTPSPLLLPSTAMSFQPIGKPPSSCEAQCPDCGAILSRKADMNRHRKTRHSDGTEKKYVCGTTSNRPRLITRR